MKEYEIITSDSLVGLYTKINDKIKKGFIPIGGVTINNSSKCFKFIQVIYKGEE